MTGNSLQDLAAMTMPQWHSSAKMQRGKKFTPVSRRSRVVPQQLDHSHHATIAEVQEAEIVAVHEEVIAVKHAALSDEIASLRALATGEVQVNLAHATEIHRRDARHDRASAIVRQANRSYSRKLAMILLRRQSSQRGLQHLVRFRRVLRLN